MSEQPEMPQPTKEHQALAEHVGTWNVECTFYMDPSKPPMEVKAKDTVEMFGPFWTSGVFEAEMFGSPYQGRATLGYDPQAKEYVSTWIDSMSPTHFLLKGQMEGNVLEMRGRAYDCMLGQETDYRTHEEHRSPDERVFEMFMTLPDGNEVKMFTHVYTRAR